ncbi:hypothetical protein ACFWUQ_04425 [Streptomyces sp. NPDC058662]|uniref:hypothetical protein n=1 Tax=Streptomyces sp. NPDC058662 TaxID=3346583 RepID=UPI00364BB238
MREFVNTSPTSIPRTTAPVPPTRVAAGARVRAAVALLALPVLGVLAGCGNTGGLVSAGSTPTVSGPVHLWPDRAGAAVPPPDPGGAPPEYVQGLPPVRDQDVHGVDPVALVRAEVRTHAGADVGADGMPAETAAAIDACGREGAKAGSCPVLAPYYRDLTGNGKDELIVGIELPEKMMSVRVYTADPDGRLNRIMATTETVIAVDLAGRDVMLRVPSGNNGYELITAWSWDEKQRTMLPTREQIVRVSGQPRSPAGGRPKPGGADAVPGGAGPTSGTGGAPGSASATGAASGTAAGSAAGAGAP